MLPRLAALVLLLLASGLPAQAQTTAPPPTLQAGDAFGEPTTLTAHPMIVKKGEGNWDNAFETLVEAFKAVKAQLDRAGIKPSGPAMTVFTSTDPIGFEFEAGYPVAEAPQTAPADLALRRSPEGKTLKFVHRGSYESMTTTDEAIMNHLDEKRLDQRDLVIGEAKKLLRCTDLPAVSFEGVALSLLHRWKSPQPTCSRRRQRKGPAGGYAPCKAHCQARAYARAPGVSELAAPCGDRPA